jgi:hypothetical protein
MRALLVVPDFPIPAKRKVNHDFLPIGLLKVGTYLKNCLGWNVSFSFGNRRSRFVPDEIWITSLFTYWSKYVEESARFYRDKYPKARIRVGGIYASLMPDHCKESTGADVHKGLFEPAENWCAEHGVDYRLLRRKTDFQILHGMRGCFRRCKFCGTWKIEPKMSSDRLVAARVVKNHVVFYDNNFLKNRFIRDILKELAGVRVKKKRVTYESQSGFDGRVLDQELADLLHNANFINPRIAWDNSFQDWPKIERQVMLLENAGYKRKDISIFMLCNWEYPFEVLENKRLKCWKWGVQVSDCRFRPLNQTYDNYSPRTAQTAMDYFINDKWTDAELKQFRKNVRRHNICVRHDFDFHSKSLENMRVSKKQYAILSRSHRRIVRKQLGDAWYPDQFTPPENVVHSTNPKVQDCSQRCEVDRDDRNSLTEDLVASNSILLGVHGIVGLVPDNEEYR